MRRSNELDKVATMEEWTWMDSSSAPTRKTACGEDNILKYVSFLHVKRRDSGDILSK